ncbi:MAG: hypothetical protein H7289_14670 [Mucilaginibacter sp.]|nr:hypothetical protein [Mucilaginibacter sp.]
MQKVFLIVCFVICICSCKPKSVWTEQYEHKQYRQIDLSLMQGLPDNTKRKQLVHFLIERLKSELPAGVESISIDSLKRLSSELAKEYAYAHKGEISGLVPHRVVWTKELENNIREAFLKDAGKEELPMQTKGCNCMIAKLKTIYPDSATVPFPKDTLAKVAFQCRNELLGSDSKNQR